jgi:hypothetical protein
MSNSVFTTEKWQALCKSKSIPEAPEVSTDEFDARLNRMIANAETLAVREYQLDILSVLYQMDRANASVQSELVRNHCPEDIYAAYTAAWDGLKRLIWNIEKRKDTTDDFYRRASSGKAGQGRVR